MNPEITGEGEPSLSPRPDDQATGEILPLLKKARVTVHIKANGVIVVRNKGSMTEVGGIELKRRLARAISQTDRG